MKNFNGIFFKLLKEKSPKAAIYTCHWGSLCSMSCVTQLPIQFISSHFLSPQRRDLFKWKAVTVRATPQTIHTAHICIHTALMSIRKSIEIYITISLANPHASRPVNDAGRVIQTVFTDYTVLVTTEEQFTCSFLNFLNSLNENRIIVQA